MHVRAVHILYATVTGTAEDVALALAQRFALCEVRVASCLPVDDYDARRIPVDAAAGDVFVFVVATAGDGEAPASMQRLWTTLRNAALPRTALAGVHYAVFGLGDRSYPKFNAAARRLATRLQDVGAATVCETGLGDDSASGGYDAKLIPWTNALFQAIVPAYETKELPQPLPPPTPRLQLYLDHDSSANLGSTEQGDSGGADDPGKWRKRQAPESMALPGKPRARVTEATVIEIETITTVPDGLDGMAGGRDDDEREVRHIRLDASAEPAIGKYTPGDIVHAMVRNRASAVSAFLNLTSWPGNSIVRCRDIENSSSSESRSRFGRAELNIQLPCRLDEFVSAQLDLSARPRRRFIERLAAFATDAIQKQRLLHFCSADGADDFVQYAYREKRTILLVLRDFPSARPPFEHLVDMIPVLQSRAFSLASSYEAHASTLHICARIVRYTTPLKFVRTGVCSDMWLRFAPGDIVPVFLETGTLRFDQARPAILIGPGTGVAPMRSFVSAQLPQSCARDNEVSDKPVRVLYFGCRRRDSDYLYAHEWEESILDERLTRVMVAFSREAQRKVYVHDKLVENGEVVWDLLSKAADGGACVYVAGAAGDMPKGVCYALSCIAQTHGHMSETDAEQYVKALQMSRRLQIECW